MQLLFCRSFVRTAINTTSPAGPQHSSLYRRRFQNVLIGYYGGLTPSSVSSLPPRPHQSTCWSACNSDKAILNGIRSAWPWRIGSVINHCVLKHNRLLMPIRGSNVHLFLRSALILKHRWLTIDLRHLGFNPLYKTSMYACLSKHKYQIKPPSQHRM